MNIIAVIPAYNPPANVVDLVRGLRGRLPWPVIVVNDGSSTDRSEVFEELGAIEGVTVLRHAVNVGKGAALKTGFNHALIAYGREITLVTLDADGQHLIEDVGRVGSLAVVRRNVLILGVRRIGLEGAPLRSFIGNTLTRALVRILVGVHLQDTQTGLRAIPGFFAEQLLKVAGNGYDFELEMLMMARHTRLAIVEQPISTVYDQGNTTSHFNPVTDSAKIYFVLLRFLVASLVSALVDNILFACFLDFGFAVVAAQAIARCTSVPLNFAMLQRFVFYSRQSVRAVLPRYVVVVIAFFSLSSALIAVTSQTWLGPVTGKVLVECALFPFSFLIQRDFVFARRKWWMAADEKTDWDSYYESPFPAASVTRRYTARRLVASMSPWLAKGPVRLAELGGANSCFFHDVHRALDVRTYRIVDNNPVGLAKTATLNHKGTLEIEQADVLTWRSDEQFDVVYSVGLIEHFSPTETAAVIRRHFEGARPGGLVLMTAPTPTILYRLIRAAAETLGIWRFPDERPLLFEEVHRTACGLGTLLHRETLWPLGLTQLLVTYRAKDETSDVG